MPIRNDEADPVADDILAHMRLREKAIIANLPEADLAYLQFAFDSCLRLPLGVANEGGDAVIHTIWKSLQRTHRIRCVK